ncbi:hypothetical protein [Oceaniglobus roseus]|nr:hypothetical protein [Kandeliimicrobium roseum]
MTRLAAAALSALLLTGTAASAFDILPPNIQYPDPRPELPTRGTAQPGR